MTPLISLLLVGGLVLGVTLGRRKLWKPPSGGFALAGWPWLWLSLHLGWCLVCAGSVWFLNWALWPNWPEGFEVLVLLCLESVLVGLLSWVILCRPFQPEVSKPQSSNGFKDEGGIVRYTKAVHARGQLPPGIEIHWNEQHRRWSNLETVKED